MNALTELARFQIDRDLHKREFNLKSASLNIIEELLEAHGVKENKERLLTQRVYLMLQSLIMECEEYPETAIEYGLKIVLTTEEDIVDAFCDIQVFAGGEVMKLGYDNEAALTEVAKEINSRKGKMMDDKFVKFTDDASKALWYKANFNNAKISNPPVSFEINVDEVSVDITLTIDGSDYGHSIKMTDEVNEDEAIAQVLLWKQLMIEDNR